MSLDNSADRHLGSDGMDDVSTGKATRVVDKNKLQQIRIAHFGEIREVFASLKSEEVVVVAYTISGKQERRWIGSIPELERFFKLYGTKNMQGEWSNLELFVSDVANLEDDK